MRDDSTPARGGGPRRGAPCRHTVPDWARHVRAPDEVAPILAACALLVKQGEVADDPRAIACGFWGRQDQCPLYEGPERPPTPPPAPGAYAVGREDEPLTARAMRRARLRADGYAPRGPLTETMRQRRRASGAALALLLALATLALWLVR